MAVNALGLKTVYYVPRTGAKDYFYTLVDSKSSEIVKNYSSGRRQLL